MQLTQPISRLLSLSKGKSFLFAATAAIATLITAQTSNASIVSLMDRNSSVTINPIASAGVDNWTVNGINQLNQEWFWYSAGNSGQSSIDALGLTSTTLLDTNGNGQNDTVKLVYGSSKGLQITLTLTLAGGQTGSEASDLGETIKIANNGSSQMDYHFYAYTNFNLDDSITGQTATITGGNTATVIGDGMNAQTTVSPKPSEFDASNSPTLLNKIASSSPYTLPGTATSSSGDSEWAFEWDLSLCTGDSTVISIDKNLKGVSLTPVPEPSGAAALSGLSALFVLAARPRRGRKLI